jgi:hypothetical protein
VLEQKQQQKGAAVKQAAAAAAGHTKAGVKGKGPGLLWPASRPIITCAAIEQVRGALCPEDGLLNSPPPLLCLVCSCACSAGVPWAAAGLPGSVQSPHSHK